MLGVLCGLWCSPSHELLFSGMKEESDIVGTLTLKNICDNPVAYKARNPLLCQCTQSTPYQI